MERESFEISKIKDYSELVWEGALGDEDNLTYEVVSEEIYAFDLEKCYVTKEIIFVRYSDNKYFRCYYDFSYHWKDPGAIATEVFPKEIVQTITIYE